MLEIRQENMNDYYLYKRFIGKIYEIILSNKRK